VSTGGSTCWCCRLQLKNWKISWYTRDAGDQTLSDSEYEEDDEDDGDDEDRDMQGCGLRPPSKQRCVLGYVLIKAVCTNLNFVPGSN